MSSSTKESKDVKGSPNKDKKRTKKTVKTDTMSRSSSPDSKRPRSTSSDASKQNARALFFHEENSVDKRNPEEDLEMHLDVCEDFRGILGKIKAMKQKSPLSEKQTKELAELRMAGTLHFASMRRLNRLHHFRCKKVRDGTHQAKQKIDQQHLQLQNLLYEVMHLQREINKCLQFKSNDEDVKLVTVDDFYKEAPPEISKPDITQKDFHQQTLARLDWELTQRKRLSEELRKRDASRAELAADIQINEDNLGSLQPKLRAILQVSRPVQDSLGMRFDEMRKQHQSAAYLPRPLYVLFMQASAYQDACDRNVHVSIEGEVEEAKSMDPTTLDFSKADDESDSEAEDQEEGKDQGKKRRRRRTTEGGSGGSSHKDKVLKQHPLTVTMLIKLKEGSGPSLQLTFHYLLALEIVTLKMKLDVDPEQIAASVSGGDLLSPESLLAHIYHGDLGDDTPNHSNKFALQKFGLGEFSRYTDEVGRPYRWVQWLCGLQFLREGNSDDAGEGTSSNSGEGSGEGTSSGSGGEGGSGSSGSQGRAQTAVSATHMEETIRRLRRRLRARLSLQQQMAQLERHTVAVTVEFVGLFPSKVCARLVSWKRSTFEDFAALPHAQPMLASGMAGASHMYFTAVLERGAARLTASLLLPSEYPSAAPAALLHLHWHGDRTALNDTGLRELEAEVNVHYAELVGRSPDQLLTNQLQRLLVCFDVYLETETGPSQGPAEFAREKIFPRIAKGPHRGKPYLYNAELGFFAQR